MHVLFVVCPALSVLAFVVDHPFGGQSVVWDQRDYCCLLFLTPLIFRKIAVMHWSEPNLTTSYLSYCVPGILVLGTNDPDLGTPFAKAGCLQWLSGLSASHSMCRPWFLQGLWAFQPFLCVCRWVLPLHDHPLWHATKRLRNKVSA